MKRNTLLLPLFAAVLASSAAFAVTDAEMQAVMPDYLKASTGEAALVEKSLTAFSQLAGKEPTHPLLAAYRASTVVLQARDSWLPWKKVSYAEEGLADLDHALGMLKPEHNALLVRGVPVTIETRFVAASTFVAVPGFMNRGEEGKKMLLAVATDPRMATLPAAFRTRVFQVALRRLPDANPTLISQWRAATATVSANAPTAPTASAGSTE